MQSPRLVVLNMHLDWILLLLTGLLLATLAAFFSGMLPYPFGLIILSIFIIARILYLRGRQ